MCPPTPNVSHTTSDVTSPSLTSPGPGLAFLFPSPSVSVLRQAVIIEPLRPERFQITTFNSTPLYILSVCEVPYPAPTPALLFSCSTPAQLLLPSPAQLLLTSPAQVCGSYQCPFCPFYNSAPTLSPLFSVLLLLLTVLLLCPLQSSQQYSPGLPQ